MIFGAVLRQKSKMLLVAFTIALGASLATAMLNVMFAVGDKVNQELKTYGANINVLPKGATLLSEVYGINLEQDGAGQYLQEDQLGRIKTIFWAFNIVDFTPYLNVTGTLENDSPAKLRGTWFDHHLELPTGETLNTGMKNMKKWWELTGEWVTDNNPQQAMIGSAVAEQNSLKLHDTFTVMANGQKQILTVSGIFNAGGEDDDLIYIPLATAQKLTNKQGLISQIEVSALTTPDNELARRAAQNPQSLSIKDWETWYCTAYVSAISYQIEEVITDSVAKPIRQVAASEGAILEKTQLLMMLITVLSLIGSALGISNIVTASVMERSREIGLLKALGATNLSINLLILTETFISSIVGGSAGYLAGLGFAQIIGHTVFGSAIEIKPLVIPLVIILILLVTLIGSIPAIRMLLGLRPAEVLHGR